MNDPFNNGTFIIRMRVLIRRALPSPNAKINIVKIKKRTWFALYTAVETKNVSLLLINILLQI